MLNVTHGSPGGFTQNVNCEFSSNNVISRTTLIIIHMDSCKSRNKMTKTGIYLYVNYVDH